MYCGIFALIVMAFFSRLKLLRNVDFMVGLAVVVFAGLFIWSFAQMDSVNINNYIDSLKNGDNIFIKVMNNIFFTVPLFLKALGSNNIVYMLLFVLVNAGCVALLFSLEICCTSGAYTLCHPPEGQDAARRKLSGCRTLP